MVWLPASGGRHAGEGAVRPNRDRDITIVAPTRAASISRVAHRDGRAAIHGDFLEFVACGKADPLIVRREKGRPGRCASGNRRHLLGEVVRPLQPPMIIGGSPIRIRARAAIYRVRGTPPIVIGGWSLRSPTTFFRLNDSILYEDAKSVLVFAGPLDILCFQ